MDDDIFPPVKELLLSKGDDNLGDDSFPPVAELLLKTPFTKASSALKSQRNQQDMKKLSSNATGIHIDYRKLGLDNRQGSSQGGTFTV
jgi:hypothetical protein